MRFTRHLCFTSTVLSLLTAGGCAGKSVELPVQKNDPLRNSTRIESPDPAMTVGRQGSLQPSPNVPAPTLSLAEKMAAYAREIDPKLQERQARVKPPANAPVMVDNLPGNPADAANAAHPPTDPPATDVRWTGGGANVPVDDKPALALATPPAKRPISRGSLSDVPQIVPEGDDGIAMRGPITALDSDHLLKELATKVKDNPRDLLSQLDYQLLQFVRGEQVPQMQTIAGLPTEDREVLSTLMDGLSNFRGNLRNESNQMLGRKVRPLVELADRLRSQSELSLPVASFCTRVDGYGVYEPVEPARFVAGREHPVIIYVEVDNFASQVTEKKLWETRLSQSMILYTESGLPVWNEQSKQIVDSSRNRRRDFFIAKKTKLPSTLTIGRYVLKISVTDLQSNRVAETTVPVQVLAQ